MEPGHWPSEHSDALRDYFLKGMSYAEIGRQINARFGTAYTRNAVIGRAKRLGLVVPEWMTSPSIVPPLPGEALVSPRRSALPNLNLPPKSAMKPAARVKLRCVGVQPRLIELVELEAADCRYPYGGDKDGEEITFCGHPRQPGSSYCAPHTRLTRRSGAASARIATPVALRLVSRA
ncbi:GcrA family cell cycle regulator [Bradyrhizobium huanghuaihaiense]|uniref:GcrA family cell cycle regulator n=1 Tax=Bradyrhizobium huanghuaihaiense TaxID=990078 RepID=UPI0021AA709D|nr:GcrA family cell cycle regulator [Bradyrhizobium sp. CB3035]UWU79621.1 GcrA family cell cycle regulator [Bradyrhizobium sp. CB3035]